MLGYVGDCFAGTARNDENAAARNYETFNLSRIAGNLLKYNSKNNK